MLLFFIFYLANKDKNKRKYFKNLVKKLIYRKIIYITNINNTKYQLSITCLSKTYKRKREE
jgi:hypothetical protein